MRFWRNVRGAMGSRGRSIRLRIYFLVAIPLVTMVGLLAYLAATLVTNAINLDRAPNLINATSLPTAKFVNDLQSERAAALVYLFQPTQANLVAYDTAVSATNADQPAFLAAMNSPATKSSEDSAEAQGINTVVGSLGQLTTLRDAVRAGPRLITPLKAYGAYTLAISNEPKLLLAEADSLNDATVAHQALALIAAVSAREALSQEAALLSGPLAGRRITQADRSAFTESAANRQATTVDYQSLFSPANLATYDAALKGTQTLQQQLSGVEQAVLAGFPVTRLPVTLPQWQALTGSLLQANYNAGVADAAALLAQANRVTSSAWTRVGVIGGIGLVGLLLTIVVTTLVGRGIIRRLRGLEGTALTLAEQQLPDVIARLRRGDDVDPATEAPQLRVGQDEIGRVGQAFDLVRQTAIRAAVEEAKLRRGLNDVFRSLARRSQSLLHRQLTLLDQMERRASDPEALDDLFRLDHLTTRMRRHAEGLVILSGAPPGRAWSSPVRMVDVMRGAIAEVEDYARVSVATRSQAALSGSAVADVIHLLAELIENATTLSPPYTSVRVAGDTVANGFAIEVEDRGLGMSQERIAELNGRLANPPEFNPSDSEQLGLFVVGQLARRHDIKVTLRASPYGGTSAVVLVPRHLVVTEEAFRAGLPGEPAALTMTPADGFAGVGNGNGGNGNHDQALTAFPHAWGGETVAETPGVRISGAMRATSPPAIADGPSRGAHAASRGAGGSADPAPGGFDVFKPQRPAQAPGSAGVDSWGPDTADLPAGPQESTRSPAPGAAAASYSAAAPYPGQPTPFGGWADAPSPVTGSPPGVGSPPGAGSAAPATPMVPVAGPRSGPPWELSPETGPLPAVPDASDGSQAGPQAGEAGVKGLPRRVRQASLAPQLKGDPPYQRRGRQADGLSGGPTPAEIRRTMSALQRGLEEGRSQPAAGPQLPPAPGGGDRDQGQDVGPAADVKARGESDGS
jgi:signal transduction histidine kinase